jgi:hypothetical protein
MGRRLIRFVALAALAALVTGCVTGGAPPALPVSLLLAALMGLIGCSKQTLSLDGPPAQAEAGVGGAGGDAATDLRVAGDGGAWQTCCENGRISSCYCAGISSCNYGLGLIQCPDGRCGYGQFTCSGDGGVDATPDAPRDTPPEGPPGRFVPCCLAGKPDSCYCGPSVSCNYAPFQTCPDGTCVTYPIGLPDSGPLCRVTDGGGGQ